MWQQHWQQRQQNTILIKAQWTHQIFKNTFWMIPSIHFFLSKSFATWQTRIIFYTQTHTVRSICNVINYVKECSIKLTTDSFIHSFIRSKITDPGCYKRIINYQHHDMFDKSLYMHTHFSLPQNGGVDSIRLCKYFSSDVGILKRVGRNIDC